MPEMSVVRFNESDVIVASRSLTLHKYGDGSRGNAYVTYNGITYGTQQQAGGSFPDNLYQAFNGDKLGANFNGSTDFHWEGDSTQNFTWIIGQDNTNSTSSVDGTYWWNGSSFDKLHQ